MLKKVATRESLETASQDSGVISFDCKMLVAGIAFHLVDEGFASSIDADSVARATDRIRRAELHPCITKSEWAAMNNQDRLQWLLVESRTCAVLSGSVAALGTLRTQVITR